MKEQVSLMEIFGVFAKVGAFTIGGGYAMIPIIQREMNSRGWIGEDELPDIIALAQSAPGVLAVNMSIFAGYKLRGVKGSIAATLGATLPSFVTILLIAILFSSFKDSPVVIRIFQGYTPGSGFAHRRADDQHGRQEQPYVVGMGDFFSRACGRSCPEILSDIHTACADRAGRGSHGVPRA